MSATQQQRADWSLKPRGTVSAAAQGALGLVGTALTGSQHPPRALGYRLGCWLGAGGWLTWSWTATPWAQAALATLGLGTLAAGLLAPWARTAPPADTPGSGGGLVVRRHVTLAAE
ncbi:hypothetical protein GCM10017673_58360 [Streptosporangium violaceochromogenes]|nr:hypothetical protein GCM10017673_58360 [Streptosporangium violaceochromogenes]